MIKITKGIKAFVSWIRSYKAHQASFIFQLKQVDVAAVCRSFCLFRIPKVPELKNLKIDFEETRLVLPTEYKNPNRIEKEAVKKPPKQKIISWSKQKECKVKKQVRIIKKQRRLVAKERALSKE